MRAAVQPAESEGVEVPSVAPAHEGRETAGEASGGGPDDAPKLDPVAQAHLGALLRTMYRTLVDEPIPGKFLDILGQLDAKETDQ